MKVVILCGGYGTRIREVSDSVPKPMVPIGNYPILWHIMKYYAHWGHSEFVLCLGYKGDVIKDFFLNYESRTRDFTITLGHNSSITYNSGHAESDWSVTLAETGLKAMTGARIKRVEKYLAAEDNFMLTYGDAVSDVDLSKLVQFHLNHGKILTITGVRPPGRFGELVSDSTGKIVEFNEKPQVVGGGRISGVSSCAGRKSSTTWTRARTWFSRSGRWARSWPTARRWCTNMTASGCRWTRHGIIRC